MEGVVFGQYMPGDSVLHRLDPRTKLIASAALVGAVFAIKGLPAFLGLGLLVLFLYAWSGVAKTLFKILKPGYYLLLFTLLINMLFTPGEAVLKLSILSVTREGVLRGFDIGFRIIYLLMISSLVTLTTSPVRTTDAMEWLLKPLKRLGIPVSELTMMMNIALRFIPTFWEEIEKITKAQKARGADFESRHPIRRLRYLQALLIPLFVSAFRKADELATAMESRGYTPGMQRTSMHRLCFSKLDYVVMVVTFLLLIAILLYRFY